MPESRQNLLEAALCKLSDSFARRNWKYLPVPPGSKWQKTFCWPGTPQEDIMICVHRGTHIHEDFHRQDFFFFNFAYKGSYGAFSHRFDNHIIVHENECYIGQPYAGYALNRDAPKEFIIIGVLMKKETFYRSFLPVLSSDAQLFQFFLHPKIDQYSDEFIHLKFDYSAPIRALLEMMIVEYAFPQEDTQALLKPLVLSLLMHIARQYKQAAPAPADYPLCDQIVRYISDHSDTVTLKTIAKRFSYHPNYISALLHRKLHKTFSQLVLEFRLERAQLLLTGSDLSVEEIAYMLGYSNSSNFYKVFREYYHCSPRDYVKQNSGGRKNADPPE